MTTPETFLWDSGQAKVYMSVVLTPGTSRGGIAPGPRAVLEARDFDMHIFLPTPHRTRLSLSIQCYCFHFYCTKQFAIHQGCVLPFHSVDN